MGATLALGINTSDPAAVSDACAKAPFCFFEQPNYVARTSNLFYDDTVNTDGWQQQVYDYGRAIADKTGSRVIADVGCGSAFKLIETFGDLVTIGLDLEPTLSFLRKTYPSRLWLESSLLGSFVPPQADLVISADAIEHIPDVDKYMRLLRRFCAKYYVVSTPDRAVRGHLNALGPPRNGAHVREWTHDELAAYAASSGFKVLDARSNASPMVHQNTFWLLLELEDVESCRK